MQADPEPTTPSEIAAWVDQTIASYGAWDAVSFLLRIGRLSQVNYEAWRLGEVETLEEVFAGNPQRIIALLDQALQHVLSRGFHAAPQTWLGWGKHVEASLRLFADDALQARFSCVVAPATDRPQLDLFMDAQHVVCFNRIRAALLQRHPNLATMLDDAFEYYANEPALARLEALYVAAKNEYSDIYFRFVQLNQEITPIAIDELGALSPQADDYLSPLWRHLAKKMQYIPFDAENPHFHASTAWLKAKVYDNAIAAVTTVEHGLDFTVLHMVLIQAHAVQQQTLALRAAWLQCCLHCPRDVSKYLDAKNYEQGLQSCGLLHWWHMFLKLAHRPSAADFPAWLMIQQPDYLPTLLDIKIPDHAAGQRFLWVKSLLEEQQLTALADIPLRKKLKESSPWLFSMLLKV